MHASYPRRPKDRGIPKGYKTNEEFTQSENTDPGGDSIQCDGRGRGTKERATEDEESSATSRTGMSHSQRGA